MTYATPYKRAASWLARLASTAFILLTVSGNAGAVCVVTGELARVHLNPAGFSIVYVEPPGAGLAPGYWYWFRTQNLQLINILQAAHAGGDKIVVRGSSRNCPQARVYRFGGDITHAGSFDNG